jgi:hypothetical protein
MRPHFAYCSGGGRGLESSDGIAASWVKDCEAGSISCPAQRAEVKIDSCRFAPIFPSIPFFSSNQRAIRPRWRSHASDMHLASVSGCLSPKARPAWYPKPVGGQAATRPWCAFVGAVVSSFPPLRQYSTWRPR